MSNSIFDTFAEDFKGTSYVKFFTGMMIVFGFPPTIYQLVVYLLSNTITNNERFIFIFFSTIFAVLAFLSVKSKSQYRTTLWTISLVCLYIYLFGCAAYYILLRNLPLKGLWYINFIPIAYIVAYVINQPWRGLVVSMSMWATLALIFLIYFIFVAPFVPGRYLDDALMSLVFAHAILIAALFQVAAFREHYASKLTLAQAALAESETRRAMENQLNTARTELARANRSVLMGALASSIAHEINQPLGAIMTNAGAAARWLSAAQPDIEQASVSTREIALSAQRAGEIIGSVRGFLSKGEAQRAPFDFAEMAQETIRLLEPEARSRGVALSLDCPRMPLVGVGSRSQLQQVLINLIMNAFDAVEALPARSGCVSLQVHVDSDGVLSANVLDNGPGLPDGDPERLFEALFTTKDNGTGMGLTICRMIMDAHGGSLIARPAPDGGAAFLMRWPLQSTPADAFL